MLRSPITALLITTTLTAAAAGEERSVDQIVDKANHVSYYQADDGRADVQMVITDDQGRTRERRFTILRRDTADPNVDGEQRFYVYFHRPADVNKMVFMVHKHIGRDDDRWLYLPSLDLVKRIAATDKRTSFVGSDFYYEDVSGRQPDLDRHEFAETTDTYYKLRSTPKQPDDVEFDHYITWIHKTTFIPVKTEYYDASGSKYREYRATAVEKIDGYHTVTASQMKDLRTGSKTTLSYSDVQYNVGLPENLFTERYLRRAPMKYLR
jgi:outer membrane lipoprotein-sorting protein